MDGNRRSGQSSCSAPNASVGHKLGAEHMEELLVWCVASELLPAAAREALEAAVRDTAGRMRHLTLAIAYDGRGDIVEAIRSAIRAGADVRIPRSSPSTWAADR